MEGWEIVLVLGTMIASVIYGVVELVYFLYSRSFPPHRHAWRGISAIMLAFIILNAFLIIKHH